MRVHLRGDSAAGDFADRLLDIGNGHLPVDSDGMVTVEPNYGQIVAKREDLYDCVYPDLARNYRNTEWLCERAILAPRNDMVSTTNEFLLTRLPGQDRTYKSVDDVVDPVEAVQYPTEFLNSLNPAGLPQHNLRLKVGCPIMLLRNLDVPKLCNGTQLVVKRMMPRLLEATIITGPGSGENVFIPRIPLRPSDTPFEFQRLQFPVRVSFAMTTNKSQGQSKSFVGLDLETPCFSHGQFYVGCSRVGRPSSLFIFAPGGRTKNIVYQTALQ